ncbi:putative NF-kappa-B-repressing factor [Sesbania bispinosa]|nr:putative NF-kappa-B-repressing factor [Sesbania bispinosa]
MGNGLKRGKRHRFSKRKEKGSTSAVVVDTSVKAIKGKGKGKNAQRSTFVATADTSVKKQTTGNVSKFVAEPSTTSFGQQTIVPPIPDFVQKLTVAQLLARMMAANERYVETVRTNLDAQSTQSEVTLDVPLAVVATQTPKLTQKMEMLEDRIKLANLIFLWN